ncbi:MAG TPA: OsmC family protein [Bryobacteraceae bacterium]|nr:OsmC family protein [Bryobacteraceae bacterium]
MEVKVTYKNGMQYEAEARGHKVLCDQPLDAGGADGGMTPPEFLLASLGTCVMYYAANYLRLHQISADGMTVAVQAGKAANPGRLDDFVIQVEIPATTEARHLEGARRSAEKCLIKNTLAHAPRIDVRVGTGVVL